MRNLIDSVERECGLMVENSVDPVLNKMIFVYCPHQTICTLLHKQIETAATEIGKENPHKINHNQIYQKKLLLLFLH